MKALKQKVPFKKVAKTFSDGHKLPKIPEVQQKKTSAECGTKKLKIGRATSSSSTSQSTSNEEQEDTEDKEEFQSSYVLTMSQMISGATENKSDSLDDSGYVFEPCTQVRMYLKIYILSSSCFCRCS